MMADPAVDNRDSISDVEGVEVAQDTSAVATLTVGAIADECPPHGSEVAVVYNLGIACVRDALDTLGITIPDRHNHGVCKAALARYYQELNASRKLNASRNEAAHHAPGGPDKDDGFGTVSTGSPGDTHGDADLTHAALCQQVADLRRQL